MRIAMIPSPDDEAKLEAFNEHIVVTGEALQRWLDKRFSYSAAAIFFLCSVLDAQIQVGWPDEDHRPSPYNELMKALAKVGAELGPMIAAVEVEGLEVIRQMARPH
jgi:hypothetical protein